MDTALQHIIEGCQQNKRQAQKALYDRYAPRLLGVCMRYAACTEEAEDILHDGIIKILEKIGQFGHKGSFEGWMRRIMVNTALERFRGQYKVIQIQDNFRENYQEGYENIIETLTAEELMGFIQELSPKYRMVFNLYAVDGFNHQEIAEKMGISVGTSKSNLSRARSILQEKVGKYYEDNVHIGSRK